MAGNNIDKHDNNFNCLKTQPLLDNVLHNFSPHNPQYCYIVVLELAFTFQKTLFDVSWPGICKKIYILMSFDN
jgi:hypothetical protein